MVDINKSSEPDDKIKVFCRKCNHYFGRFPRKEGELGELLCPKCKTTNFVSVQVMKVNARQ